jgi:ribosome biogenesis GTPase A
VVDQVLLIDLLLFSLNQPGAGAARYSYVKAFEFDGPTDDIEVFMEHVGRRYGFLGAGGVVNDAQVCSHVLSAYRAGKLGKLLLDQ